MNASEVLDAIGRKYPTAALLREVALPDEAAVERRVEDGPIGWTRRIDGLMWQTLERTAIEVKVSVADARRETWEKVWPWKRVTHRFVYAVPAGLIEVPPIHGCGLWWVHEDGRVEVRVKTTVNRTPEPLPQSTVQAIAYRAMKNPTPTTSLDTHATAL